jgi:imidazolonepropionase-like amidohydrolase/Tol biopolymer transport system component
VPYFDGHRELRISPDNIGCFILIKKTPFGLPQTKLANPMTYLLVFILTLALTASSHAQNDNPAPDWHTKWNVGGPQWDEWPTRELDITTDEGTWMNLDVSPDGRHIVFDLLGNIYIMPAEGGTATALRANQAYEIQPRFSPDGQWISFTSDHGGGDNIWVMRRDGSDARQVTNESFRLLNNAFWTPEGDYLIARKHFTSTRSLGAGELWMYHITGGSGIQLVARPNDQQDLGQPFVTADGRYVYYSQDVYSGGFFQYNKDPNSQIYVINRYDRETGETRRITGGNGGAISPTPSPDGTRLAFARRVRTETVLFIRDLESGIERPVFDDLSRDQQEAWAIFGPYTNFNWTPDGRHLIFWSKGKIRKLNVETLESEVIPFEAHIRYQVGEPVTFRTDPAPESFTAKVIRHAVTSPDGRTLVFNAAGYLWRKDLPDGTPRRLTDGTDFEYEPVFSPDGRTLVYVTWSDTTLGRIMRLDLSRRNARPQSVTTQKGIFREPAFSPDGRSIVFRREGGNNQQGHAWTQNPGIYTMPAAGGEKTLVSRNGSAPRFNATGDRIFYLGGGYLSRRFQSVDLSGNDQRTHFRSTYANNFVPSPDNRWIAFNELFRVYIAPMPRAGTDIDLNSTTRAIPVTHVALDAGINLHWSGDGSMLHWTLGEEYFSVSLEDAFTFLREQPNASANATPPNASASATSPTDADAAPAEAPSRLRPLGPKDGIPIALELPTDIPNGTIAFTNARVITVNATNEVIENGTVVVRNNRIIAVGASVTIPNDAMVIDLEGKTLMPGLVDVHAHIGNFRSGLAPQQQWEYFANLAFGVTTVHDPSSDTEMIHANAEMVRAGVMRGPRIYSTGRILYGAEGDFKAVINSLEDARSAIRRTQAYGAISVKSYNQPRRDQRQQVLQAARELGVLVVPEGGSTFTHNMSMLIDGHTGIEHNIPIFPVYKDVMSLWRTSRAGYTPTLVVNFGTVSGEYYWYQNTNVWENERLLSFTPRSVVDSRSRHRTMIPDEEYSTGHVASAELVRDLHREGINTNLGSHGQMQGLGAHWELWMFHQGGMTPMETLRAVTLNGASYIGMDEHIGSVEAGKLADLIVIDGNPLEDIRLTERVTYTMINGRLFDAATLNELGHQRRERLPFWWEQYDYNERFQWHATTIVDDVPQCVCGRD